jgi:hypothetical protein
MPGYFDDNREHWPKTRHTEPTTEEVGQPACLGILCSLAECEGSPHPPCSFPQPIGEDS